MTISLKNILSIFCFMACTLFYGQEMTQRLTNNDNYRLVADWPRLSSDSTMGQPSGLGVDSQQNLIIFHRAGATSGSDPSILISRNTILKLDTKTGRVLNAWGSNLFCWPHGLNVDRDDNIWVTDVGLHQVFKFAPNGTLLMKLGIAGEPGSDSSHFNQPTDVAVAMDGSFYVADGYGNSRIVKFSASGKFLFQWGRKGNGRGQFQIPHSVDIDGDGNVIVADRENARVQKFDTKGNFLEEWRNPSGGAVYAIKVVFANHSLFAVDYLIKNDTLISGSDIIQFRPGFHVQKQFGRIGSYDGPVCRYHDIELDNDQNIYVADLLHNRVQKFQHITLDPD